jgi:hypothetical protein
MVLTYHPAKLATGMKIITKPSLVDPDLITFFFRFGAKNGTQHFVRENLQSNQRR